jgi:hypothetical protein
MNGFEIDLFQVKLNFVIDRVKGMKRRKKMKK